jgi:hypothetical protein
MLTVTYEGDKAFLQRFTMNNEAFHIGLYIAYVDPLPGLVFDDLTECDSDWYGRHLPTWSDPFINSHGKAQTNGSSHTWVTGDPEPTVTIYGAFYLDDVGTLQAVDPFEPPIILSSAVMNIEYQPVLTAVMDVASA